MSIFDIAVSGMTGATARLNVSAQNVANSQSDGVLQNAQATSGATPAADPATPKVYAPMRLVQLALPLEQGGGVETSAQPDPTQVVPAYNPSAPFADASGQVAAPAVDLAMEAVNQIEAIKQFKASVKVFKAAEQTMRQTLSLKV
jgi:flagellar basal-body rod protein FlgC